MAGRRSVHGVNTGFLSTAHNRLDLLCTQDFYEDVFEELAKFGEVENLNICDNIADHMVGSVYVKFIDENAAAMALQVRVLETVS